MHELGEINYHGEILFHFYGEPLTDERLPELVRYAKKIVPHAELQINTNGFLLTIEKYNLLANAGVKRFFITQYGKDMPQNIKNLLGYLKKNNKSSKNILYRILGEDLGLSNRGGELKVKNVVDFDRPICNYPNTAIQIDYAGNLVLCCNDYHSSIKLGNLNNQKLLEILNSHAYKKLRKEIRNGIYNLQICRKCVGLTKN
jgi:radical SAM protein with 4Fe4S-binding SPASM domain